MSKRLSTELENLVRALASNTFFVTYCELAFKYKHYHMLSRAVEVHYHWMDSEAALQLFRRKKDYINERESIQLKLKVRQDLMIKT